ncbi:MAG: hypothetical protein SVM80_02050 [Halobacteriota archaeon]|nr:hypothetical protein [Halobacteriota archaeon]
MTDIKLTDKGGSVLDSEYSEKFEVEVDFKPEKKSQSNRPEKRAEKIAKKEAKNAEKEAKRSEKIAKKEAKKTGPIETTAVVTEKKESRNIFQILEDLITSFTNMILGGLGLLELGVGVVREIPAILKWLVKFIFSSGIIGKKEMGQ